MAEKKTIIIDVKTEDGVKSMNLLETSFEDVYGEVAPLNTRLGELEDQLYQLANAGKANSDEFKVISQEVGRMKKVVAEVDLQVDALAMTTSNQLGGALTGIASGFELVQGAMGAMGVESEEVEATLLKVQSAMAMAQGVQGVKEAIPAFMAMKNAIMGSTVVQRILNVVMAASPIALIVAGIAAVAGAVYLFSSETDEAAKKQEELKKAVKRTAEEVKKSQENFEAWGKAATQTSQHQIDLLKARGGTAEEVYQNERKLMYDQLRRMNLQVKFGRTLSAEQWETHKQLTRDVELLDAEYYKGKDDKRQEDNEKAKAASEKSKEDAEKALEERLKKETEAADYEKFLNEGVADDLKKFDEDKALKDQERITKEMEDAQMLSTFRINNQQWEADEQDRILAEAKQKRKDDNADKEAKILQGVQMTIDGLNAIADIADVFAGDDLKRQKKAFQIRKAANIASAVMDTYKGAASVFADTPGGVVIKSIAAGIAVAAGFARVAAIAKTKFEGGSVSASSGGGGGGGGGGSAASISSPANFNIVGNSGTNQLLEGLQNAPVQAYVVSGEVTTAQGLDRNRVKTATL